MRVALIFNIMRESEIEELDKIQNYLLSNVSDDPSEIKERLSVVATYHSRLSFLLPEAKRQLRKKKTSEINETIIKIAKAEFLSAKVQNALLDSICDEEQFVVDRIERLQASCTHDIDANRSVLSYMKQELNNLHYNTH